MLWWCLGVVVVVVGVVVMVVVSVEEGWLRLGGFGEWELVWLGRDMGVAVVTSHRSRCWCVGVLFVRGECSAA